MRARRRSKSNKRRQILKRLIDPALTPLSANTVYTASRQGRGLTFDNQVILTLNQPKIKEIDFCHGSHWAKQYFFKNCIIQLKSVGCYLCEDIP